jgi:hypothetical protein
VVEGRRRHLGGHGDDDTARTVLVTNLDGAELLKVAGNRGLGGQNVFGLQSRNQLGGGGDYLSFQ